MFRLSLPCVIRHAVSGMLSGRSSSLIQDLLRTTQMLLLSVCARVIQADMIGELVR